MHVRGQRELRPVVLQQHHRPRRGAPDDRVRRGVVGGHLVRPPVGGPGPLGEGEQPGDRSVEVGLLDLPGGERGVEVRPALPRRARHLEVESGEQRLGRAVRPEPVAHHHAVEAPLVAQHVGEQPPVLAAVRPVEPVVAAHHGACSRSPHGRLERDEVQLAQGALVDLRRDRHPLELGVVADEVLDARGDALGLQTLDVGDGQLGGEHRVLAEALEVAPTDRGAMEVDRRGEEHAGALRPGLPPEGPSDVADQVRVPGGAERAAARERRRAHPVPRRPPRSGRPVGHPDRRHRRIGEPGRVPQVGTGEQVHLLVDGEVAHGGRTYQRRSRETGRCQDEPRRGTITNA